MEYLVVTSAEKDGSFFKFMTKDELERYLNGEVKDLKKVEFVSLEKLSERLSNKRQLTSFEVTQENEILIIKCDGIVQPKAISTVTEYKV